MFLIRSTVERSRTPTAATELPAVLLAPFCATLRHAGAKLRSRIAEVHRERSPPAHARFTRQMWRARDGRALFVGGYPAHGFGMRMTHIQGEANAVGDGTRQPTGSLRVAIDAHMVGERETGNETYILNLVRGLMRVDTTSHYLLYTPHVESLNVLNPLPPNFAPMKVNPA